MKITSIGFSSMFLVIILSHARAVVTQENLPSSTSENCSFEYGMCGWNNISAGWKIGRGSDGVNGTGPTQDHTYKNDTGGYIYLDSKTVNPSQSQMLLSPLVHSNDSCLSLWYHMRGNDIGNLTISTETNNAKTVNRSIDANYSTRTILWSQQGELDENWYRVQITIQTQEDVRVNLEGTTNGTYGEIAVDDIQLSDYSCKDICNFDFGFCNWIPKESVGFRWKRTTGVTSSNHNGSQSDDANGSSKQYYMYINTSLGRAGTKAILSHAGLYRPGQACLSFRYHMSGENMGNLTLYTRKNDDSANSVWHKSGDQGNNWITADVDLNVGPNLIVEFEAIRGNGSHGDILLDDTSLTTGYCNDTRATTPANGLKESTDREETKQNKGSLTEGSVTQSHPTRSGSHATTQRCNSTDTELDTWATTTARGLNVSTDGEKTKQKQGSFTESSVTQSHPTRSGSHTTTHRYNSTDTGGVILGLIVGTVVLVVFIILIFRKCHLHIKNTKEIRLQSISARPSEREENTENCSYTVPFINPGRMYSSDNPRSDITIVANETIGCANVSSVTNPFYLTNDTYDTASDDTRPRFDSNYDHVTSNAKAEYDQTHVTLHARSDVNQTYDHVTTASADEYDKTYVMTQAETGSTYNKNIDIYKAHLITRHRSDRHDDNYEDITI